MKSIINYLVAIFIFGVFATGFSQKALNTSQILIQSTDVNIKASTLSLSADIISSRLKCYSGEKFDVITIPGKNQIQVTLYDNWDLGITENLLTQRGELAFFETYYFRELKDILTGDSTLFSLLQTNIPADSSLTIFCSEAGEIDKWKKYLDSVEMMYECMFAWGDLFDAKSSCIYALKTGSGHEINLKLSDIESLNSGQDSIWKVNYLGFKFKAAAVPIWADVTKNNINRGIALVLDGHVLFAPVVREEISGGNCQLSGGFSATQVKYIVSVCDNGELPVSFKVVK